MQRYLHFVQFEEEEDIFIRKTTHYCLIISQREAGLNYSVW